MLAHMHTLFLILVKECLNTGLSALAAREIGLFHVLLAEISHQPPSTPALTYADARESTHGRAHSCRKETERKRARVWGGRAGGTKREITTINTKSPHDTKHEHTARERAERAPSARKHTHQVGTCQLARAFMTRHGWKRV